MSERTYHFTINLWWVIAIFVVLFGTGFVAGHVAAILPDTHCSAQE